MQYRIDSFAHRFEMETIFPRSGTQGSITIELEAFPSFKHNQLYSLRLPGTLCIGRATFSQHKEPVRHTTAEFSLAPSSLGFEFMISGHGGSAAAVDLRK
jgi:hypothetical protein